MFGAVGRSYCNDRIIASVLTHVLSHTQGTPCHRDHRYGGTVFLLYLTVRVWTSADTYCRVAAVFLASDPSC